MPRPRGAIMTPRHRLSAAYPHQLVFDVPASFGIVPKQLSMWMNSTYGCCVTTEEAYAKAVWSIMQGLPELFVPDSEVQRWAGQHGWLNGAVLDEVMDAMAQSGFNVGGTNYTDGPKQSIQFRNWAALTSAIFTGPVKFGIDADDLENAVNTTNGKSGWYGTGWTRSANQDHCVSASVYGSVADCYRILIEADPSVTIPSNANLSAQGIGVFTWDSVGVVEFPSLAAIASEAWVRTPTTPQQVGPVPTPTPTPTPNVTTCPATAIWMDPVSKTYHNGSGWPEVANNMNQQFVIAEGVHKVSIRKGLTKV